MKEHRFQRHSVVEWLRDISNDSIRKPHRLRLRWRFTTECHRQRFDPQPYFLGRTPPTRARFDFRRMRRDSPDCSRRVRVHDNRLVLKTTGAQCGKVSKSVAERGWPGSRGAVSQSGASSISASGAEGGRCHRRPRPRDRGRPRSEPRASRSPSGQHRVRQRLRPDPRQGRRLSEVMPGFTLPQGGPSLELRGATKVRGGKMVVVHNSGHNEAPARPCGGLQPASL